MTASAGLREEVSELYFDYVEAIENGAIDLWPSFFDEQCVYKLISKENHESGLPLALIFCDSQGMLKDRVFASMKLNVYAPRVWRYSLGRVRAESASAATSPARRPSRSSRPSPDNRPASSAPAAISTRWFASAAD
jgi:anthranilate 1,2-dioxygenase small subunit